MEGTIVKRYAKETADYELFHGTAQVLGREVRITKYSTACGLSILVEGGDKGHIGSVSAAMPGMSVQSIVLPDHEEAVISEKWAARLCREENVPVTVSVGLHFDGISKAQIVKVLERMDEILEEISGGQYQEEAVS